MSGNNEKEVIGLSPTTQLDHTAPVVPGEGISSENQRPSVNQIIRAARREAQLAGIGCSRRRAKELFRFLQFAIEDIRDDCYEPFFLEERELKRLHPLLEVVMPDDVVEPLAGSAHDLINRYFIEGSEFAIIHTRDRDYAEVVFCAIAIAINTV